MTLRQTYTNLQNQDFVKKMVVTSVYNTMQLEGQTVPKEKIEQLYNQVKEEQKGKGN